MTKDRMKAVVFATGLSVFGVVMIAQVTEASAQDSPNVTEVIGKLNEAPTIEGRDAIKSYQLLFDAYLELSDAPFAISASFNLSTVHPNMDDWSRVSSWAESNPAMADAIIAAKSRRIVGLPYGRDNVPQQYRSAGLIADVGAGGNLRQVEFPYLDALEVISAYAWAEVYRRMESGQVQEAIDLATAHLFVVRQFCDREFLEEKRHSMAVLVEALSNMRDMFYMYRDKISADQFREIAVAEIPFLRPDRNALLMPEGDRIVSEALIKDVFDSRGRADASKFPSTFAALQAQEEPMTRFGAARRWAMIAEVHDSLDASLERLTLVYDDWWRRWRVQEYDPILDIPTQFERTNRIRYAAVLYSIENIETLFERRKELIVAVNSTAVAAGLCAYEQTFGNVPRDHKLAYAQFVRKASDVDPYDLDYNQMLYFLVNQRHSIDTPHGRLWIEPGEGILYSRGQDHADDRASLHTYDGLDGDIVVWPPIRAIAREQGLLR